MKRKMIMLFATVLAMAFAVAAHGATGSSAWFVVDTTDGALKVSDVRSRYFDGEYDDGSVGRKATFLNGVSCNIEMTILDDPINVDHWLVNGREVTTRTFTFDVGSLPVGGRLEVVAVGKEDGVRSKPFRANFDVAEHVDPDPGHKGLWTARPSNSEGIDEIRYTPVGAGSVSFLLAPERKKGKPKALSWLPGDEWSFVPKIELKPEARSGGNGSCTFGTVGLGEGKLGSVLGKDIGIAFTGGPLTLSWNPQKREWVAKDVSFSGKVNWKTPEKLAHHYYVPGVGAVFYNIDAEFALEAEFKVSGFDSALSGLGWGGFESSFTLGSECLPKVTVTGGYGLDKVACIKGEIAGMSVLEATRSKGTWTDFRWGLRGSGAVKWEFLVFDGTVVELTSDTLWIINDSSPKSMRLMSSAPSSDIEWRLQPRDYLTNAKPRMRLLAAPVENGVVESGGYPDPTPAMASGIAGDAFVYLRDDGSRTSANRTELVTRMGASNEWGVAESVWNDGTADFMPSLAAMPDGSFAAAWMNAARTFSDSVDIADYSAAEEIAVGIRDAATGNWTCRNLTADGAFDFAPTVRAAANGKVLVAWLRNASGKMISSAAEPTDIMAAIYMNGAWGAPAPVLSDVGVVNGFDVAFDGESAVLAFSKDADGDMETTGDAEIYAVRLEGQLWGSLVKLTAAGDADGAPIVRGGGEEFSILWTAGGALMETRKLALSNAVAVAAAEGWTPGVELTMIRSTDGRDALLWNGNSTAGGAADAPTAMMYDPICGAWGSPVKLLDDGRRERRLAGAVGADGGIRIGYESSSVATNEDGAVTFGNVELRTRFIPAICDLAVVEDGFSFSTNEFVNGEGITLSVKAANRGFRSATNATVRVYEGAGDDKSELASVVTNFPSGGVVAANVPWMVDNTQTNLKFTVEIDAGGDDEDETNNIYVWSAGVPDVSFGGVMVRNESATRRLVTARVGNSGLGPLPAGGKVVFRRGGENGEIVAEDELGTVWPGSDGVYDAGFAWDMAGESFSSAWETVCIQLFPDGVVGSVQDAADMAFVQVATTFSAGDATLFPELVEGATAAENVSNVVQNVGFVDTGVIYVIGGSVEEYNNFADWARGVKGSGGVVAGEAAVVASEHAAAAYLLGAEALLEKEPTVELGEIEVGSEVDQTTNEKKGTITLSVTVKDGENAVAVASEKVKDMFEATSSLGDWDGEAKLTPNVEVLDGEGNTMRFKVTPGDGKSPSAFLRIRK